MPLPLQLPIALRMCTYNSSTSYFVDLAANRDLSDFQLNSALGRFDGQAYEALLETTEVGTMAVMGSISG